MPVRTSLTAPGGAMTVVVAESVLLVVGVARSVTVAVFVRTVPAASVISCV
jgi:hypothetical protein